jgi:hypothetical protein
MLFVPSAFAVFPDPEKDPRHYLMRYYTEIAYQEWFDKNFPNDSTVTTSFTIDPTTDKIDTRVRARSIALKIANTSSAEDWKLGTFRLDIQPDGRRG